MKVKSLTVKNFTVFDKAAFEFSPGVNVLIGANATGKSHVLKMIYSTAKAVERTYGVTGSVGNGHPQPLAKRQNLNFGQHADIAFYDVFNPADGASSNLIRTLLSSSGRRQDGRFSVNLDGIGLEAVIKPNERGGDLVMHSGDLEKSSTVGPCVFIPPREALAMYEGFQFAYANRELSFDGTYDDICFALSGRPLKGDRAAWAKVLISTLERELDGKVQLKGNRFYVGKFEAHLVAEGLRKVASVVQLLRNGSIGEGGILFWDEPEAGLNPRLMKLVASFLLQLASKGVQVFAATHDYILSSELSLPAEYETELGKSAQPRFFCLTRESLQAPVTVEVGDVLAELRQNPILAEFAAHYDREQQMFISSGTRD